MAINAIHAVKFNGNYAQAISLPKQKCICPTTFPGSVLEVIDTSQSQDWLILARHLLENLGERLAQGLKGFAGPCFTIIY